jgi:hypothetical protein
MDDGLDKETAFKRYSAKYKGANPKSFQSTWDTLLRETPKKKKIEELSLSQESSSVGEEDEESEEIPSQ